MFIFRFSEPTTLAGKEDSDYFAWPDKWDDKEII